MQTTRHVRDTGGAAPTLYAYIDERDCELHGRDADVEAGRSHAGREQRVQRGGLLEDGLHAVADQVGKNEQHRL